MPGTTHLKSLQALEMAIRSGSLKEAAARLCITPAAVGQRIRALESYLGAELLVRGRTGLQPSPELERALGDLQVAFAALDRASDALDLERVSAIQIVADVDWAELWLLPRLPAFRGAHPNILFCINGTGDAPSRGGAADVRVFYGAGEGEPLFTDVLLAVSGPDNLRRFVDLAPRRHVMEGMPLLHLRDQLEQVDRPGWIEWFRTFGMRESGHDRGVRYDHARLALKAVRRDVGFLVCGLSLLQRDLDDGSIHMLFPMTQHLVAPHSYRLALRQDAHRRPQVQRFLTWLRREAAGTRQQLEGLIGAA